MIQPYADSPVNTTDILDESILTRGGAGSIVRKSRQAFIMRQPIAHLGKLDDQLQLSHYDEYTIKQAPAQQLRTFDNRSILYKRLHPLNEPAHPPATGSTTNLSETNSSLMNTTSNSTFRN